MPENRGKGKAVTKGECGDGGEERRRATGLERRKRRDRIKETVRISRGQATKKREKEKSKGEIGKEKGRTDELENASCDALRRRRRKGCGGGSVCGGGR